MNRSRPASRRRTATAFLIVAALVLGACSGDSGSEGSRSSGDEGGPADVLPALATAIEASYVDLAEEVDALGAAVDELCTEGGDPVAELESARDAWRATTTSYARTRAGAVGPAVERRLMADVHFRARASSIEDLVAGSDPLDVDALADAGAAVRGLGAAEVALFAEGSSALGSADGSRRCAYLASVTELVGEAVDAVVDDWASHEGGGFPSIAEDRDEVAELLNEVVSRVRELDEMGLRDLAAAESLDGLLPTRLDGPAAYAMAERRALMAGIESVIGDEQTGLAALVADRSPDTAERLVASTGAAATAVSALPDSVAAAFEQSDDVATASEAVAELKVLLATEVASQLGVTITFSDSDGDS